MFTPLLVTFSNTEKSVNVYRVPAVRDETVWVTGPSPSGTNAMMSISAPSNWRIKLSVLFTLFHCRVILVSSCPIDLKLSALGGTETESTTCYLTHCNVHIVIFVSRNKLHYLLSNRWMGTWGSSYHLTTALSHWTLWWHIPLRQSLVARRPSIETERSFHQTTVCPGADRSTQSPPLPGLWWFHSLSHFVYWERNNSFVWLFKGI